MAARGGEPDDWTSGLSPPEDRAFHIRWEEYKLVQDKIDKIGAFRFRLRGWLITLIAAVATAAFSAQLSWIVFVVGLLTIAAFHVMESQQERWVIALASRASLLEKELQSEYGAPKTAQALRTARIVANQKLLLRAIGASDIRAFYIPVYALTFVGLLTTAGVLAWTWSLVVKLWTSGWRAACGW
jgi:hypothetical protein